MSVATRLREIVQGSGITYTFLSKKTGISVDKISRSFMGNRRLPADEMIAICIAMNLDLNDLRGAVPYPSAPATRKRGSTFNPR